MWLAFIHTGFWLADFSDLQVRVGHSDFDQLETKLSGQKGMNIHLSHYPPKSRNQYLQNTRNHFVTGPSSQEDVDQSHLGGWLAASSDSIPRRNRAMSNHHLYINYSCHKFSELNWFMFLICLPSKPNNRGSLIDCCLYIGQIKLPLALCTLRLSKNIGITYHCKMYNEYTYIHPQINGLWHGLVPILKKNR